MFARDCFVHASKLALLFGALALAVTGCANNAQPASSVAVSRPVHMTGQGGRTVEVLLDRQPERAFKVVEAFYAKTASNPRSIEQMKDSAAAAGLDGIYWIDCSSPCSGLCTAKGFVYTDETQVAAR